MFTDYFINYFSGPHRAVGPMLVSACLSEHPNNNV